MGCASCGGNKTKGATANNPFILGDNTGPTQRVISSEEGLGVPVGRSVWVRGSDVDGSIAAGSFRLLDTRIKTAPEQRVPAGATRVWRVGAISYTDLGSARNRSAQTGEPIQPVSI